MTDRAAKIFLALIFVMADSFAAFSQTRLSPSGTGLSSSASPFLRAAPSPAWPKVRGPFSWADKVMNSTTIARSGKIYRLREKTQGLYRPALEIKSHDAFQTQLRPVSSDLPFFSYAIGNNMLEDAAALLFARNYYAPSDTLDYLKGLVSFEAKDFERAYDCFSAVGPAGDKIDSGLLDSSNLDISSINHPNTIDDESSLYNKAQLFLNTYSSEPELLLKYKNRSPLLAAAMSAVVPGAGKIYAGDLSSGVSTMLIVGALGAMTAESIVKLGIKDWRSISLASIFGLFYIGNIYGSYLSVSIIQNTISDAQKATLLFNIRIPLHELP